MRSERFPPVCAPTPGRSRRGTSRDIPSRSIALSECPDGVRTVRPRRGGLLRGPGGKRAGPGGPARASAGPSRRSEDRSRRFRARLRYRGQSHAADAQRRAAHTTGVTTFLVSPPALTAREPCSSVWTQRGIHGRGECYPSLVTQDPHPVGCHHRTAVVARPRGSPSPGARRSGEQIGRGQVAPPSGRFRATTAPAPFGRPPIAPRRASPWPPRSRGRCHSRRRRGSSRSTARGEAVRRRPR